MLVVFLLALVIRIIFIATLQDGYYFSDSARYEEATRHIVAEGQFPREYGRAPLYPVFLAAQYATVGDEILKTRIIQSVLNATVAALLVLIGFRTGGYWVGAFAGGLWSIYPMAVFVSGTVYPATLLAFLLAAAVFCLVPGRGRRAGLAAIGLSGLIFGVAALAKPIVVAAILTVTAWLFAVYKGRRLVTAGLFLLAAIIALTPWTVRNYEVFGKFVPIEARGIDEVAPWAKSQDQVIRDVLLEQAILAKIMEEKATAGPQGGPVYQALAEQLEEAAESPETQVEPTLALPLPKGVPEKRLPEMIRGIAIRFPGEFLSFFELYPRRVGFLQQQQRDLARAWKNPRLVEEIPFGNSLVNAVSAFAVSFLYIFALLGIRAMWLTRSAREYLFLYLGLVLSFAAGYALSWGKIRYRVPVDPYIILLSAWGVYWAWSAVFGGSEHATAAKSGDTAGRATAS